MFSPCIKSGKSRLAHVAKEAPCPLPHNIILDSDELSDVFTAFINMEISATDCSAVRNSKFSNDASLKFVTVKSFVKILKIESYSVGKLLRKYLISAVTKAALSSLARSCINPVRRKCVVNTPPSLT